MCFFLRLPQSMPWFSQRGTSAAVWAGTHSLRWRASHPAVFALLLSYLLLPRIAGAQPEPVKKILIINEGGPAYPAIDRIDRGIQAALADSPYKLDFYIENLETILFSDPKAQQEIRNFYLHKYRNQRPDVIITVGPAPLRFMVETHQRAFPGVPVVFCLPTLVASTHEPLDHDFAGVETEMAAGETLEAALHMRPDTKHVVVVGGVSRFDRDLETAVQGQLKGFAGRVDITYLTDLAMPELLVRLHHLPEHTIVLFLTVAQDAAGSRFKSTEAGPMIASAANAPVFGLFDTYVGHGEVGGNLFSFTEQGKTAGSMALKILKGERPQDLPRAKGLTVFTFDEQALRRWGIPKSALPSGSVLINHQPTIWELYKRYIIAGIAVLFAQTAAIIALLWQWSRKRKALAALEKSEEKFSKSFRNAPMAVTLTNFNNLHYIDVNETFEAMTGWGRSEVLGRSPIELGIWANPQQKYDQISRLQRGASVRNIEFSMRTKTGEMRTALMASELVRVDNQQCMLSIFSDITDQRRALDAISESEKRFNLVANAAPVMIWMSDTHRCCNYVNQTWLTFTGRSFQDELGSGWTKTVHPEDLDRSLDTYSRAYDRREPFEMEFRARRHDGEYRWIFDLGVPRFNDDGSFAGYIGSCIDVTERKLAEEALSTISRKLIEAHEEERTWIARELHDDINQRLALLTVNLDMLDLELPASAKIARHHAADVKHQAKELGMDVQALSHRLHSSKLEYLGLSAAASAFCREFSVLKSVQIEFHSENIPKSLPQEISLCLFRVLQEALQNAAKHSGAQDFRVLLTSDSSDVLLAVSDSGCGFNLEEVLKTPGLGLTSMKERLKIVHGELHIESGKDKGTIVTARVPVRTGAMSAVAAKA